MTDRAPAGATSAGAAPANRPERRIAGPRYRRILWFAARLIAHVWWFDLAMPRMGLGGLSRRTQPQRMRRLAARFRVFAVGLGGLMIKVGQFMSSRLDVLPPEITGELAGLQDEVPPASFPAVRQLAEQELGMTLERAYAWFDPTPMAAASLGQAHRARLSPRDAAQVGFENAVVKVQRPGIGHVVDVDLAALRRIARWLRRIRVVAEHVDVPALVEEFARTSMEEIDYLHEGANAERFGERFTDDPRVGYPEIVWERTTRKVLTMSDVTAIKVTDTDGMRAAGIDPAEVASTLAEVMFDQLFGGGFIHADPHPGNLFVTPAPKRTGATNRRWTLTFVDFGMMADIPPALRDSLRRLLIAIAARDGQGLVDAMGQVGVLLPTADTRALERAMTSLFARFGGMGFTELQSVDPREFRDFAVEFGDVIRSLPFQFPQNFLLIIRAASLTSGVCTAMDPKFNVWHAIEPYADQLAREQGGLVVSDLARQAVDTAAIMWRLPRRLDDLIDRLDDGRIAVVTSRLEKRLDRLERLLRVALTGGLAAGALFFATRSRRRGPGGGRGHP